MLYKSEGLNTGYFFYKKSYIFLNLYIKIILYNTILIDIVYVIMDNI